MSSLGAKDIEETLDTDSIVKRVTVPVVRVNVQRRLEEVFRTKSVGVTLCVS